MRYENEDVNARYDREAQCHLRPLSDPGRAHQELEMVLARLEVDVANGVLFLVVSRSAEC